MKLNTHFAIALFLLISSACQAQTATGQSSEFIPGDENYTLMLAFHRTDTILVVTPDGFDLDSADRELIEAFPFWGGHQKIPHYRYLNEKDLEPHDYTKRIQYYGPFFMFRELSVSALFRHEAAHSLIEQVAGHNPYCFFSEGFAVSTEYFFTREALKMTVMWLVKTQACFRKRWFTEPQDDFTTTRLPTRYPVLLQGILLTGSGWRSLSGHMVTIKLRRLLRKKPDLILHRP